MNHDAKSKDNSEGKWYSVVLSKFSENHECVMGFLQWLDISSSQVCVFQSCQQEPSRKKVFVGTLSDGGRVAGWLNRKEGVSLSRIQTKYSGVRSVARMGSHKMVCWQASCCFWLFFYRQLLPSSVWRSWLWRNDQSREFSHNQEMLFSLNCWWFWSCGVLNLMMNRPIKDVQWKC